MSAPIVDMTAVRAALCGIPVALTEPEKHWAVHYGSARMSLNAVAVRLGMSLRRARMLHRTPPARCDVSDIDAWPLPEDCEVAA